MADNKHNQWLREIALEFGKRYGKKQQHDNFRQKKRIFCNSANHCCFANLKKQLRKKNSIMITNGYIYLITKFFIGTAIA